MKVSEAFPTEGAVRFPIEDRPAHRFPEDPTPLPPPAQQSTALLAPVKVKNLDIAADDVRRLNAIPVDKALVSAEDAGKLNRELEFATQLLRQLEIWRKEEVDPRNAIVKKINLLFKPLTQALEDGFIPRAGKLLGAWIEQEKARIRREQETARLAQEEAARREAEAEARAAAAETPEERSEALVAAQEASVAQTQALITAPEEPVKAFRGDLGSTTFREVWKFEVVSPAAVPRRYLTVDEKAIRKAVEAGTRQIDGVNIYPDKTPVVRIG